MRVLQTKIRDAWCKLLLNSLVTQPSTTLASNSISTAKRFKLIQNLKSFLRAQSLAPTLNATPIGRVKPLTQLPLWSRIKPPPLAIPGLPNEEPSVLNFIQPNSRLFHRTWKCCLLLIKTDLEAQNKNSLATASACTSLYRLQLKGELLNTTLFLCNQSLQTSKRKTFSKE